MKKKKLLIPALAMFVFCGQVSFVHAGLPVSNESEIILEENDPNQVLARYIQAVGGKENVAKIKNSVMTMEAELQGMTILIKGISDQENGRLVQETSVMGNVASKTILANGKGKMIAMGQEQELPEDMISLMKAQTYVFPEEHYEALGYQLELRGTEDVDGEEAHTLIVTAPNGMKTVEYYSVKSNLKLRTSSEASGDITYGNYQEIDGVKVPMTMTIKNPMMPMALEAKVTSMKFNQELSDEDFK